MIKDKHYYENRIIKAINAQKSLLKERWNGCEDRFTKYIFIDNLLPEEDVCEIYQEFLKDTDKWIVSKSFRESKSTLKEIDTLGIVIPAITDSFHSEAVIKEIEDITGISNLEADPSLYAGGMSKMKIGDFLSPHVDNSHDQSKTRYRRLNLLYYVSPDWQFINGGNLELWDRKVNECEEIVSLCNRLVIMETNDRSYHSVNKVKVDQPRCCVSNYYFSKESEKGFDYHHVTSTTGWPNQTFLRLIGRVDTYSRDLIAKVLGKTRKGGTRY